MRLAIVTVSALLIASVATGQTPRYSITEFPLPTPNARPKGITVGPDGNLWFTEYAANKIGRITPDGVITEFSIPTPNSGPTDIVGGPHTAYGQAVFFTEFLAHKIGHFKVQVAGSPDPFQELATPTANSGPRSIAIGGDGAVWFTEFAANKIGKMNSQMTVITEFNVPTASSGPWGITTGAAADLYFTEYFTNKVGRVFFNGTMTDSLVNAGGSGNPTAIAASVTGRAFVLEEGGNKVATRCMIGCVGAFSEEDIPTAASLPTDAVVTPDGMVWFTQSAGNRIGYYSPGVTVGVRELTLPNPGSAPHGITFGPDGNIWFTEELGNRIGRINLKSDPGDATADGMLNPADVFKLVNHLFAGGPKP